MQDESDPTTIWVSLHVAQLCCCGHSFKSLTTVPKQNTAYTVFYPPWGGHIYVDPDLKSFIKPAQEFKDMVDSLSGSHLDISTAASPQLFVALNSTLQFITSDMDIFVGQSTATLAAKVRTHITTRDVLSRNVIRQAR